MNSSHIPLSDGKSSLQKRKDPTVSSRKITTETKQKETKHNHLRKAPLPKRVHINVSNEQSHQFSSELTNDALDITPMETDSMESEIIPTETDGLMTLNETKLNSPTSRRHLNTVHGQ